MDTCTGSMASTAGGLKNCKLKACTAVTVSKRPVDAWRVTDTGPALLDAVIGGVNLTMLYDGNKSVPSTGASNLTPPGKITKTGLVTSPQYAVIVIWVVPPNG